MVLAVLPFISLHAPKALAYENSGNLYEDCPPGWYVAQPIVGGPGGIWFSAGGEDADYPGVTDWAPYDYGNCPPFSECQGVFFSGGITYVTGFISWLIYADSWGQLDGVNWCDELEYAQLGPPSEIFTPSMAQLMDNAHESQATDPLDYTGLDQQTITFIKSHPSVHDQFLAGQRAGLKWFSMDHNHAPPPGFIPPRTPSQIGH